MIDLDVDKDLGAFSLSARIVVPGVGITALFGHSGAGKTSLVNLIAGVSRPDRGHIRVGDVTLFDSAKGVDLAIEERAIGYVFQDSRLFPHLDVEGNLRYGARRASQRARTGSLEFASVVEVLGIAPLLGRRAHHLSGGERQRVALGRALLSQPRLMLMDEPLASLDPTRKSELMPYIERLRNDFGIPILYVSHSIDEITRLADHLVLLADGRCMASGDLYSVMGDPAFSPLIGRHEAGVVLQCVVEAHDALQQMTDLAFLGGRLRVPRVDATPGAKVRVRLRARDVALARERAAGLSISNQIAGTVRELIPRIGPYVEVVVAVGPTTIRSLVTHESSERLELEIGSPVWALIRSVALDRRVVTT